MPARRLPVVRRWVRTAIALAFCLRALSAVAQVPDTTIQRLAEIQVELTAIDYRWNNSLITSQERVEKQKPLEAELTTLTRELNRLPDEERFKLEDRISGLVRARQAILEPEWKKEVDDARTAKEQHDKDSIAAVPAAAQAALPAQRRRLELQQKLKSGQMSADEYAAEDKKALDQIMAAREQFIADHGDRYVELFDTKLQLLTEALQGDPATPLPASQVPAGVPASAADFQKDAALAARLSLARNDINRRFYAKQVSNATFRETDDILAADFNRLIERWRAAGRGDEFDRAYRTILSPPRPATAPAESGPTASLGELLGQFALLLAIIGGAIGFVVYLRRRPKPEEPQLSKVHGSARWAETETEVEEDALQKGVFLGQSVAYVPKDAPVKPFGAPVCTKPENHTLIVARTRTGKGTRVIIPTLLRYAGSVLVIDPKGENAAVTARSRRDRLGQNVLIVNPWGELTDTYAKSGFTASSYNPLDVLDRRDPNAVAVAQTLAGAICATSDPKERFWQGSAAGFLTAVFLWLADQPDEIKTLGRARQITSLSRKELTAKFLVPMAACTSFAGAIQEMASQFIDLADNTYSGVMAALNEDMRFLSDPQVKAATASSSFAMGDLVTGKTTLYLVIPPERIDTQRTWLRLMLAAATQTFKRIRPAERPDPRQRCLFLIDEFPALGRLDTLPRDIATIAGYGVDLALVVQGLDQIKDLYGDAKGTILSNCSYKWFCNIADLDTAKWLSEALGKATVRTVSTSSSSSVATKSTSQGESVTHAETGRSLINPDELLVAGRKVAFVLRPDGRPMQVRPLDYWQLQNHFAGFADAYPGLYWNPPFDYDPNPYAGAEAAQGEPENIGGAQGWVSRA